ncbi:hypothetical protein CC86DRAFT_108077 [Ophiobolus disseminans]|uniref:Uncharacterized protein n=1 Tax=Ophiobolus disseminans TaxID=1469910 RepID=A0A6A6ZJ51_9PLEO|nr:hypothetical protein CC86DRAFT_108077 [Ophiobolus disseminans]
MRCTISLYIPPLPTLHISNSTTLVTSNFSHHTKVYQLPPQPHHNHPYHTPNAFKISHNALPLPHRSPRFLSKCSSRLQRHLRKQSGCVPGGLSGDVF